MEEECPICLDITDDKFLTECCKKHFHKKCYIECMKFKKECPLCRSIQNNGHVFLDITDEQPIVCVMNTYYIFIKVIVCCLFSFFFVYYIVRIVY